MIVFVSDPPPMINIFSNTHFTEIFSHYDPTQRLDFFTISIKNFLILRLNVIMKAKVEFPPKNPTSHVRARMLCQYLHKFLRVLCRSS